MPDDESKPGPIIDLTSHASFRLDLGEHARRRLASAQHRLGMTLEDFAATLNEMVEWEVSAEVVNSWTKDITPPGDVLLAADLLVRRGDRGSGDDFGTAGTDLLEDLISERFADLTGVFPSRAAFASAVPPHVLFDGAHEISMTGLSLNLLCQQYSEQRLQNLIESGCNIRCLFLEPYANAIEAREREEDYPPTHLSMLTEMNIHILKRLRSRLSDDGQARLRLRTYDEPVRFNIVIVDRRTPSFSRTCRPCGALIPPRSSSDDWKADQLSCLPSSAFLLGSGNAGKRSSDTESISRDCGGGR